MTDGCITLKQFHEWLQKNKKYTWYLGKGGGFNSIGHGGHALIKYFYPKFDTRTMHIFRLDANDEYFTVDFRNVEKGTNILDLLDSKIKNYIKEHKLS